MPHISRRAATAALLVAWLCIYCVEFHCNAATHEYGEAAYWDRRYTSEVGLGKFEWYQSYATLKPILKAHLEPTGQLLHIGVGTSELQFELINRLGFQGHITNTDISPTAIQHMVNLTDTTYPDLRPQLTYHVADARRMPEFADEAFDTVVDKGTLDALRCGEDADQDSKAMLTQAQRALRPGGKLFVITYGPHFARLPLLYQPGMQLDVQVYVLGNVDGERVLDQFPRLTPSIVGPIDPADLVDVGPQHFEDVNQVHFAYVCTKHSGMIAAA